jgi:flagellar biosynthesis GTPase FlhF
MTRFKLGDIQPNPFRHMDRYPIRRDKVETLRKSIQSTDFWDNIVARLGPDGKPQIAYGHHRLVALREEFDADREVELIIRDLDDEQMLKIMANENMQEWGSSVAIEHETVRAVVEAYANGQITLGSIGRRTPHGQVRYAPSFVTGCGEEHASHPYTVQSVADFLRWLSPNGQPQRKVFNALNALELIEEGILSEEDFTGVSSEQGRVILEQANQTRRYRETQAKLAEQAAEQQRKLAEQAEQRRVKAEEERKQREEQAARATEEPVRQHRLDQANDAARRAREAEAQQRHAETMEQRAQERANLEREEGRKQAQRVAKHVGQQLKDGKIGVKDAREAADEIRRKPDTPIPNINDYAMKLAGQLNRMLDSDYDDRSKKLDELIKYRKYLSDDTLRELDLTLVKLADRSVKFRASLKAPQTPNIVTAEIISVEGESSD